MEFQGKNLNVEFQGKAGHPRNFIKNIEMSALHCFFCGGKECKYENWKLWTGEKYQGVNAVDGLFSNWITNKILAMQRPSTRLIKEYNLISAFKEKKIGAIFNLQSFGEHVSCGDGIEQTSGFSYLPETFIENNIKYYNFGWYCFSMICNAFLGLIWTLLISISC